MHKRKHEKPSIYPKGETFHSRCNHTEKLESNNSENSHLIKAHPKNNQNAAFEKNQ